MSRHRLPAEQGWMLFELTMMFVLESNWRAAATCPEALSKPARVSEV